MEKKTIAILLHLNNSFENLVSYGARLASALNKNVLLDYAYNPNAVPLVTPGAIGAVPDYTGKKVAALNTEVKDKIVALVERFQNEYPDVEMTYNVTEGFERNIVEDLSERSDIELIVTDYSQGNAVTVPTSVTEIIDDSNAPVCIVPEGSDFRSVERIIYATDYSKEDIPTIQKIISMFGELTPHITALHITDNVDFEERILKEGFSRVIHDAGYPNIDIKILSNKTSADLAEIINGYAQLIDADMIVILKKDQTFFDSLFRTSTTKKILTASSIPVLVFQENK